MICKKCGEDNKTGAKYCNSCGSVLSEYDENNPGGNADINNEKKPEMFIKNGKAILIGITVVLILFVILDLTIFGNIERLFGHDNSNENNVIGVQTQKPDNGMELNNESIIPTIEITQAPTAEPTKMPTKVPTAKPTIEPIEEPTPEPGIDAKLFRFYDDTAYMWDSDFPIPSEGKNCYPSFDDALFIDIKGEDPFVTIDARGEGESEEYFSLAEYPVMKICLLNNTPSTTLEMYLAAGKGDKGEDCFQAEITAEDEEFQTYVFDISELKGKAFVEARQELNHIRLDCVTYAGFTSESMNSFSIAYFGFFKTVEEANEWIPADYKI